MGCKWALASFLGRLLRCAVATRVRATSARIEAASPRRGGGAASCTGSMALSVRGFEEAAAAPSGGPPLRAASKRPGARQRNEGCSGAAPGTQRKRVVSSNPPLGQRFIAAGPQTGERFGLWAWNRGRSRSAPAGRGTPRGSPRGPHGCPERGNPHASLMCLVPATACPQARTRRRKLAREAATRSLPSRQDRRRAAGAAPPSASTPPKGCLTSHAVAATASKPPNAL